MSAGLNELAVLYARSLDPRGEEELTTQARACATKAVASFRELTPADVDEVALHAAGALLVRLRDGAVPDNPAGFVWRVALNRGRDLHRRIGRERVGRRSLEVHASIGADSVPTPEEAWLREERQLWVRDRVAALLARAPENYARAIRRHYLDGDTIDVIAEDLLKERVAGRELDASALEDERTRARNLVDQHLKRGRLWFQRELAKLGDEEGLP